jgi:hypothetical protein
MTAALWALTVACVGGEPAGEQADEKLERQRQEAVARLAPAAAARLKLTCGEAAAAKLHKGPLLRWSNPTAGSVHGEVFLWTVDERPAAIASIYRWYHPYKDSTVEFVSVSEQPLVASDDEKQQWNTKTPGIAFSPLAKAPAPAAGAGGRLVQMRAIARRFKAELADKRGGDEVDRELRMLNQPAHRYAAPAEKIVDGALFAFVEGTDPEAWLLLEAIEEDGARSWRYALARMNIDGLTIRLDDQPVQSWPGLREAWTDRTQPYVMFNFDPRRLEGDPPAATPE